MSTIERLAAFLSGAEKHPETGKWFHEYDDEALAQTPKRRYWWRKYVREMSVQAHAEYAELELRNAELVEALRRVGNNEICWCPNVPLGSSLVDRDHTRACLNATKVLAYSAQEKAAAIGAHIKEHLA